MKSLKIAAATLVAAAGPPAMAQETSEQATQSLIEEITVTATRRETSLSDTPVAVSALSGDKLLKNGITDAYSLTDFAPNVYMDRAEGGLNITIRGVTSVDQTEKGDPSVNFMLDEVIVARPQAQAVSFYDIQRIEVLRGPQGTLFGRNTTGGLVNIITNKPDLSGFSARVDAGFGNYNAAQLTGVINVPVSESFGLRAAVNLDQQDNYLDTGPATNGNLDEFKDNTSFRLSGLYGWDSGELSVQYDNTEIEGQPGNFLPVENFYDVLDDDGNFTVTPEVAPRRFAASAEDSLNMNSVVGFDTYNDNSTDGIRLAITQTVGPVDINYIGATRDFDRSEIEPRPVSGAPDTFLYEWEGQFEQDSHELRFASNGDGPLTWQAGYFTFSEESSVALKINFAPNGAADGAGLGFFQNPTLNDSTGYFAQGTYSISDSVRLTAGARYSEDEKSQRGYTVAAFVPDGFASLAFPPPGTPFNNFLDYDSDETTWKIGIDADVGDDILVYGSISTGYKAGGFNGGCVTGTPDAVGCNQTVESAYYDPETLVSFEAGAKGSLMDGSLRFDAAAFFYDYEDLQVTGIQEIEPGLTGSITENAAQAEVMGLEVSTQYLATDLDLIELTVTLLDAEYTKYIKEVENVDLTGNPLSKSPDWTVTAGYTHTFPLSSGASVDAGIRSRINASYVMINTVFNNFWEQPGYSKTDLNLTFNSSDDRWYVTGFIKNLENTVVVSTINATGSARRYVQTQAPRTFGVIAGFNF